MSRPRDAIRSWGSRQPNLEPRPLPELARHLDPATVVLRDVLHDRQAEPRPAGLARPGAVHSVEALEDAWQVPVRDPQARVDDREDDLAVVAREVDVDMSSRSRVADRVVDQVPHEQGEVA